MGDPHREIAYLSDFLLLSHGVCVWFVTFSFICYRAMLFELDGLVVIRLGFLKLMLWGETFNKLLRNL